MLQFKVKEVMLAAGITNPYSWLVKYPKFSQRKANGLLNQTAKTITLKDISKLCMLLNCTPNDLFALRQMDLPSHHALNALPDIADASPHKSIAEWLHGKSLDEVKKLMEE